MSILYNFCIFEYIDRLSRTLEDKKNIFETWFGDDKAIANADKFEDIEMITIIDFNKIIDNNKSHILNFK